VGRRWFIALVARGLDPGCKVDNVLVLEGKGGSGKSKTFSIIGGEFFCDTAIDIGDKDSRMLASQYWLCELAECVAFKKAGHDVLKNFFSITTDKFRPPYGDSIIEFKRRCIFVGTINDDTWLTDETGNRKYWPVSYAYIVEAEDMLRRDRDQLLAEAVVAYRAGEQWHFTYEEMPLTEEVAETKMVETVAGSKVHAWWFGMDKKERMASVTTLDVAEAVYGDRTFTNSDYRQVAHTLKKMGFVKGVRDNRGGKLYYQYHATEELMNAPKRENSKHGLFAIAGGKKDEEKK
jgi:predicted P-loop ATPase